MSAGASTAVATERPARPRFARAGGGRAATGRARLPGSGKEMAGAYLFVAPTTILLFVFYFIPLGETVYYSFTSWDPTSVAGAKWVGLANYKSLVTTSQFLGALENTFIFLAFVVPISIAAGLVLALLLHYPFRGRTIYRTLIFTPYIAPIVGSALVYSYLLSPLGGVVNGFLGSFGVAPINFLNQDPWAMISVIVFSIWYIAGFNMIIFLAALGGVPEVYYEAGIVDGAGWTARFRHITWPLIWPSTLFLLMIGVINAIQVFTQVYILTGGGPLNSTQLIMLWIYQQDFVNLAGGLATAGSVVLFVIGMVLTVLQLRFLGRRHMAMLG